jgi:hypothetical protein
MSFSLILKLLHIFAAFGMVTGMIGRNITFGQAAKTTNVQTAYALLRASEIFERRFVFPMGGAVFVLGLVTAWSAGWPLFGFLQGAPTNWLLLSLILTVAIAAGGGCLSWATPPTTDQGVGRGTRPGHSYARFNGSVERSFRAPITVAGAGRRGGHRRADGA